MTTTHTIPIRKILATLAFAATATSLATTAGAQSRYHYGDRYARPYAMSPFVWGGAYAYQPRYRNYRTETYSYGADRYDNGYGVGEPRNLNNPRDRQLQGTR